MPDAALGDLVSADEVRTRLLHVLDRLDAICAAIGVQYYIYAGTLIGAARHRGFIPWDDDIDVMMSRAHYEVFCREFGADRGLRLVTSQTHPSFPYAYAKVCEEGTTVLEEVDIDPRDLFGLNIDVIPFDAVPRSNVAFRLQVLLVRIARWVLLLKVVQAQQGRSLLLRAVLPLTRRVLRVVPVSRLVALRARLARLGKADSGYVGMLVASAPWRVPLEWMEPVRLCFEGRAVPAPANWDGLLREIYGNYELLPPPEARVAPHRLKVFAVPEDSRLEVSP